MKQVSGKIKLELAQYREMSAFSQFASDLDSSTQKLLARGERLTEILKQPQYAPLSLDQQVLEIFLVVRGFLDHFLLTEIPRYVDEFLAYVSKYESHIMTNIADQKVLTPEIEELLIKAIHEFDALFSKDMS